MKLLETEMISMSDCLKNCPELNLPEFAFAGRSNVGKSSIINALAKRKNLAYTSNTPGKTRLIHLYKFNNDFVIADLPGYGYAKISKAAQDKWRKTLEDYLLNRTDLKAVVQIIDARHDIQNNDLQMRQWLDFNKMNTITVVNKIDTMSKNDAAKSLKKIEDAVASKVYPFSAKTKAGSNELLNLLYEISKQ